MITTNDLAEQATVSTFDQTLVLEALAEYAADGLCAVDEAWRIRYVNRRAEELLARPRAGLIGIAAWEAFAQGRTRAVDDAQAPPLSGQTSAALAFFATAIAPHFKVRLVPVAAGVLIYFEPHAQMSERLESVNEALRESEERYRTLFDSIDAGFCILEMIFDENGTPVDYRFLEINPVFELQTGLQNAEGKTARELVPNLEEHWFQIYGHIALTGEPLRVVNGSEAMGRWFEVYACRVGGDTSRKVAVLFYDITERRQAEEQVRQARDELEQRVKERTRELGELVESRKQLLQQLVNAQEEERRRMTRELHDQLGQMLTALGLGLKALHTKDRDDAHFEQAVARLEALTKRTSETVQSLAYELRPTALDDLGLATMLGNYLDEWSGQHNIPVHYENAGIWTERLPALVELMIYRIVQEALTNVLKHAQATRVSVILERGADRVVTIVEDNGCGFDSERLLQENNMRLSFGLTSMRERAEMVGGTLAIESRPQAGTTVFIQIPFVDQAP